MGQIQKASDFIVQKCKENGIVVHRYKAKTSNSIYLKFDWGVAHSLRISDHKGVKKYHYRFSLLKGLRKTTRITMRNNSHSTYYPFREIYQCWDDILRNRKEVMKKKGKELYLKEMKEMEERINRLPRHKLYPFWKYGKKLT